MHIYSIRVTLPVQSILANSTALVANQFETVLNGIIDWSSVGLSVLLGLTDNFVVVMRLLEIFQHTSYVISRIKVTSITELRLTGNTILNYR